MGGWIFLSSLVESGYMFWEVWGICRWSENVYLWQKFTIGLLCPKWSMNCKARNCSNAKIQKKKPLVCWHFLNSVHRYWKITLSTLINLNWLRGFSVYMSFHFLCWYSHVLYMMFECSERCFYNIWHTNTDSFLWPWKQRISLVTAVKRIEEQLEQQGYGNVLADTWVIRGYTCWHFHVHFLPTNKSLQASVHWLSSSTPKVWTLTNMMHVHTYTYTYQCVVSLPKWTMRQAVRNTLLLPPLTTLRSASNRVCLTPACYLCVVP